MAWEEEPATFRGPYKAFVDDENLTAEVRTGGAVVKTFRGETAWSDAAREAGDLNVVHGRKEK